MSARSLLCPAQYLWLPIKPAENVFCDVCVVLFVLILGEMILFDVRACRDILLERGASRSAQHAACQDTIGPSQMMSSHKQVKISLGFLLVRFWALVSRQSFLASRKLRPRNSQTSSCCGFCGWYLQKRLVNAKK